MINIISIRCGLAFEPYLEESVREFLSRGAATARVVRQGGSGLIIRSDGNLKLRYQNRETELDPSDARHYLATLELRKEIYELERMSDEVVMGSVVDHLLLSHPQSELWLGPETVSNLVELSRGEPASPNVLLPDWLNVSTGAGRLLLSDQRNGRWVLLGSDHVAEMERRPPTFLEMNKAGERFTTQIIVRGVNVRLQSAFHLATVLERFAETAEVEPYEEYYGDLHLRVAKSTEGIEISDGNLSAGMNGREARKWAGIIRGELERLNAQQSERGRIRTCIVDGQGGRWALQWGDEVFVSAEMVELLGSGEGPSLGDRSRRVVAKRADTLLILLDQVTGGCVALNQQEADNLLLTTE